MDLEFYDDDNRLDAKHQDLVKKNSWRFVAKN